MLKGSTNGSNPDGLRTDRTAAALWPWLFVGVIGLAAPVSAVGGTRAGTVDFSRDVQPILADNCFACHGPDSGQRRAGLRLDTYAGATARLTSGRMAVVPRDPGASTLIQRITAPDGRRMPPPGTGKRLSPPQVATLRRWIAEGAGYRRHWAFIPPVHPPLPKVRNAAWSSHPVDRFILAQLEAAGLRPSPMADRVTLIRRVSLDLTGLPPMPEEVSAFLADTKPGAYERLVDRLLASPHYGERWARHWLDAARYADSNGYSIDSPRSIWKYRDWVIDALNRDLPFDQFTLDQLAGDFLTDDVRSGTSPNDDGPHRPGRDRSDVIRKRIATGFHRNTSINEEGGIDPEQFRVEAVVDRVNTTATVFLGLTLACARCHDHKYDPFSQREYYQLYAFLNNADEPELELAEPAEIARRDEMRAQIEALKKELDAYLKTFLPEVPPWEQGLTQEARRELPAEARNALAVPAEKRREEQWLLLVRVLKAGDPALHDRTARITELEAQLPKFVTTLVMQERAEPRETFVQIQGDFTRRGERVFPAVPAVLPPLNGSSRPNRLDLARWLVDGRNPLTARVTVNRIWQQYFGKGLVETENDFGTQGSRPTHPDLLDWLATEFVAQGWSLKAMHRLIVTSATYRQSSRFRPDLHRVDPYNRLLGRQSRLRLDAEVIRDAALAASGLLSRKIGGPSVYPPQPEGVYGFTQVKRSWNTSSGEDRYRRGLYTFFQRSAPHPALMVFDAPDAVSACTRRNRSNTPLQALTLLNDAGFFEYSRALAVRVLQEAPANDAARVRQLVRLCLAREPGAWECRRLLEFLEQQRADASETDAWALVARVVLNLDEFITRE
jgi:mono/diheme cytochrome c family protein/cytochrome c553